MFWKVGYKFEKKMLIPSTHHIQKSIEIHTIKEICITNWTMKVLLKKCKYVDNLGGGKCFLK